MPLWDTDNTCTPVPTLPCTYTEDTHTSLIKMKTAHSAIIMHLPPSPMQGTSGRSIFPMFLLLQWRLSFSRALLLDPCSVEPHVYLRFTQKLMNVREMCLRPTARGLKSVYRKNRQTTEESFHFLPFIPGDANTRLWQSVVHNLQETIERRIVER